MTLCIGALAVKDSAACIVLCSDYKVASEEFGSETQYKLSVLGEEVVALFAGSPARAKELALIYQEYLKSTPLNLATVVDQLSEPVSDLKGRLANRYMQRCFGKSYDDLLNHGERWFGKEAQARHLAAIENHSIGVELIIAGFIGNDPVLCQLRAGEITWCTPVAMIGTGVYAAEPAMHARGHSSRTPLVDALYHVYEAKKIGEASPYVGEKTRMHVLHPSIQPSRQIEAQVVSLQGELYLRDLFKEYGPKPLRVWPELPSGTLQAATF